ncbi:trypsin-like serine peptidase [Kitasatospora gansuensis]
MTTWHRILLGALLSILVAITPAAARTAPPPTGLGTTATAPVTEESARVGALFSGGDHFCSASVVDSPGGTLLLTAAHCLSSADGVTFVPGYRNGASPYGSWKVTAVHTTEAWQDDRDQDEDYALLETAPDAAGRTVQSVVGGTPIAYDASLTATARLYGYPSRTDAPCSAPTPPPPSPRPNAGSTAPATRAAPAAAPSSTPPPAA